MIFFKVIELSYIMQFHTHTNKSLNTNNFLHLKSKQLFWFESPLLTYEFVSQCRICYECLELMRTNGNTMGTPRVSRMHHACPHGHDKIALVLH